MQAAKCPKQKKKVSIYFSLSRSQSRYFKTKIRYKSIFRHDLIVGVANKKLAYYSEFGSLK